MIDTVGKAGGGAVSSSGWRPSTASTGSRQRPGRTRRSPRSARRSRRADRPRTPRSPSPCSAATPRSSRTSAGTRSRCAAREDLERQGVSVIGMEPQWTGAAGRSSITRDRPHRRPLGGVGRTPPTGRSRRRTGCADVVASSDILLIDGHHPSPAVAAAGIARAVADPGAARRRAPGSRCWSTCCRTSTSPCAPPRCGCAAASGDPADVAEAIAAFGVRRVAISRGPDPILWWDGFRSGAIAVPRVTRARHPRGGRRAARRGGVRDRRRRVVRRGARARGRRWPPRSAR